MGRAQCIICTLRIVAVRRYTYRKCWLDILHLALPRGDSATMAYNFALALMLSRERSRRNPVLVGLISARNCGICVVRTRETYACECNRTSFRTVLADLER